MRWELGRRLPVVPVALQPTQHAGHAPQLTRVSAATGRPLIVAVSGDGVYNEVVNGIFDVSLTGALAAKRLVGTPTTSGAVPDGMPLVVDAIVTAHAMGRRRQLSAAAHGPLS
jgi:diacylglycerol kinase (ATP)